MASVNILRQHIDPPAGIGGHDPDDPPLAWWYMITALVVAIVVVALVSCAPRTVVVRDAEPTWSRLLGVLAAVAASANPPVCEVHDLPDRAVVHIVDNGDEDPFRRTYVFHRELEDKFAETDGLRVVVQDLVNCVRRMSTDPGGF